PDVSASGVASTATRMAELLVAVSEHCLAVLVIPGVVGEVFSRLHMTDPRDVFPIPLHRPGQPGFEIHRWGPARLSHQFFARERSRSSAESASREIDRDHNYSRRE